MIIRLCAEDVGSDVSTRLSGYLPGGRGTWRAQVEKSGCVTAHADRAGLFDTAGLYLHQRHRSRANQPRRCRTGWCHPGATAGGESRKVGRCARHSAQLQVRTKLEWARRGHGRARASAFGGGGTVYISRQPATASRIGAATLSPYKRACFPIQTSLSHRLREITQCELWSTNSNCLLALRH